MLGVPQRKNCVEVLTYDSENQSDLDVHAVLALYMTSRSESSSPSEVKSESSLPSEVKTPTQFLLCGTPSKSAAASAWLGWVNAIN